MTVSFSEMILYLCIYSVAGWICEVIYCSLPARGFVNRGFLNGPYCPIYGVGAFIILVVTYPVAGYPVPVFAAALISATTLEYFTGWLMESIFQIRWWDYSDEKFNLKGRICLKNSIIFGLLGLVTVFFAHPAAEWIVGRISTNIQRVLASAFIAVFLIDLIYTLGALLQLTEKLKTARFYFAELEKYNEEYSWFRASDLTGSISRLKEILQAGSPDEKLVRVLERLESVAQKSGDIRITRAFPGLKPKEHGGSLERLRELWEQQTESHRESWKNRTWGIIKRLKSRTVSGAKNAADFAKGLSFDKLFWVFVSASVLGYIVETLFCLITRGVIESRQGLIYGPFSQVYGLGAVLMVITLRPFAKKNDRWLFIGSAIVGGAFEFLCSLIQETVFGSVSWEYSDKAFSIGGRTNLTYMFFWGILGLVFMKGIYPAMSRIFERIPKRQNRFFMYVFITVLSADMILSGAAVYRWSKRLQDFPPSNAYEAFLDTRYPDNWLEEIYPNLTMIK